MKLTAPFLQEATIQQEVARVLENKRRSSLVALFGTGAPGKIRVRNQEFTIHPVRSELELRALLPERLDPNGSDAMIYLVDWTEELPPDINFRLATSGLRRVSKDARIAAVFGARDVDPILGRSAAIASILSDSDLAGRIKKVAGQVLQSDEAISRYLNACVGFPLDLDFAEAEFIDWCVQNDQGPALTDRIRLANGKGLGAELLSYVERRFGKLGGAIWTAWLSGQATQCWQYALLMDAIRADWGKKTYEEGLLDRSLDSLPFGPILREAIPQLSAETVLKVTQKLKWSKNSRQLEAAEGVADNPRLREALRASALLPTGLKHRRQVFADALERIAGDPTPERFQEARKAREHIETHLLDDPAKNEAIMGLRLAGFLVEDRSRSGSLPPVPYQAALSIAQWFVRDGGFVDWARKSVRAFREAPYMGALQKILDRVDERRREMDRIFAEGMAAWIQNGFPTDEAMPIRDVSRRVVSEFLREKAERKLLVVLMDGMSQADAAQVLKSMEGSAEHWLPSAWRPHGADGLPTGVLPPVISAMPSITQVSRAAFFSGKFSRADVERSTAQDPVRWAENRALKSVLGDIQPRLLLKEDVEIRGGLSPKAIELVGSDDRVVAVVINAIDDQLKGGQQVVVEYQLDNIPALRSLLAHAAAHERAVLIVADHGHVTGQSLETKGRVSDAGGKRWRPLKSGESPTPFEIALGGDDVWVPRGYERLALIWDDRAVYGSPGGGEHGGISLAEAICPAVLVVPESLSMDSGIEQDKALKSVSRYVPEWWDLKPSVPQQARQPIQHIAPASNVVTPAAQPTQGDLFGGENAVMVGRNTVIDQLTRSILFKAQSEGRPKEKVALAMRHLALLLEAGDQISVDDFARKAELPLFRAAGPIYDLQSLLNLEGYGVIDYDRAARQIRVNRTMLSQIFELEKKA